MVTFKNWPFKTNTIHEKNVIDKKKERKENDAPGNRIKCPNKIKYNESTSLDDDTCTRSVLN